MKGKDEQAAKRMDEVITKAIAWGRMLHSTEEAKQTILALPQL
jgi:hypothetical protein